MHASAGVAKPPSGFRPRNPNAGAPMSRFAPQIYGCGCPRCNLMQFIISGRGMTVGPALRSRVERKVGKLARILPKILEARVVLSAEKYRRTAELTLLAKRRTFRSEETAEDFSSAIDRAVEAFERQVRRTKERLRGRKSRHGSSGIPA